MIQFRRMTQWPRGITKTRRSGTFRATYPETLQMLDSELDKLRARNRVIQVAIEERDIRKDGWPRADARVPPHPGVVLSFDSPHGPLLFACDTYLEWKENLRAIALTLEALRAVERYGATKHGEQYKGFTPIEAAKPATDGFKTAQQAASWMAVAAGFDNLPKSIEGILQHADIRSRVYREAARKLHPDAGGSEDDFKRLQQARELIEKGV
jgi:hypothetical protein